MFLEKETCRKRTCFFCVCVGVFVCVGWAYSELPKNKNVVSEYEPRCLVNILSVRCYRLLSAALEISAVSLMGLKEMWSSRNDCCMSPLYRSVFNEFFCCYFVGLLWRGQARLQRRWRQTLCKSGFVSQKGFVDGPLALWSSSNLHL